MSTAIDLHGVDVLVLEDDFYLADDTRRILEQAGASVVGPFSSGAQALSAASERRPTCALLDINLGEGPSFKTAASLQALGVPIIFVTGYDADVIPAELREAPCLQKPIEPDLIIRTVAAVHQVSAGD